MAGPCIAMATGATCRQNGIIIITIMEMQSPAVLAAGLIGGLIGGAIANGGGYYEPAPPPPRCWHESRPVQNEYDDGYHYERRARL